MTNAELTSILKHALSPSPNTMILHLDVRLMAGAIRTLTVRVTALEILEDRLRNALSLYAQDPTEAGDRARSALRGSLLREGAEVITDAEKVQQLVEWVHDRDQTIVTLTARVQELEVALQHVLATWDESARGRIRFAALGHAYVVLRGKEATHDENRTD